MTHEPPGGTHLSPADIEALDARWRSSWTPREVADRLTGVTTPWCVAAGWALDLFRGKQTRDHGDLEIAIPAATFPALRPHFAGYAIDGVGDACIWANATDEVLAATHQTWLRDPATGDYLLDVFREPHDGDTWICRHDESIRLPHRETVHWTTDGIPYLAPELVLLFKAKHARPKDVADFEGTLPHLSAAQRARLKAFLTRTRPGHPWLEAL